MASYYVRLIVAASFFNATKGINHAPIQVILTDSLIWHFLYYDFSTWSVWTGSTVASEGFYSDGDRAVVLPLTEKQADFLIHLKIGSAVSRPIY